MRRFERPGWLLPLLCGMLALFFVLLFYRDNKYQTPPPYGKSGILSLRESDLRDAPIFLIDGWLLTDSRSTDQPTYIGEYSNLQRGDVTVSPHGRASYRLTLRYSGSPLTVAVSLPKLSTDFILLLDGRELMRGRGSAQAIFSLQPGDQTLTVQTESSGGYYSGMYFPPALGRPELLSQMQNRQSFAYALALLTPLVLAVFTLALWRRTSDPPAFWFGLLCCCYALYIAHYFVYLFGLPFLPHWNFVEGIALYGLIFCVAQLAALAAELFTQPVFRRMRLALLFVPLLLLALYLSIPLFPQAVALHGASKDCYFILAFCCILFLAVCALLRRSCESLYLLAGCVVFGVGLLLNLFFSNHFEPILFFWQFEWCGFFLVLLFGGMMAARNRRILAENALLNRHLEQLVEKRTKELSMLLSERKAFFSDMAHDLKAPLFATQAFIRAIRQNQTGVDGELLHYIDAVERKQQEMARRVQGLSALNQLDKITGEKEKISICALLKELYATHSGEAEVSSIHLIIQPPATDCHILAQPEKLELLFENLIYNAIRATPAEGRIVISASATREQVRLSIADTGCGIPPAELPNIFDRFYVGEQNRGTGTGLGLYIARSIITELGGEISVSSQLGAGTEFVLLLPAVETHLRETTLFRPQ